MGRRLSVAFVVSLLALAGTVAVGSGPAATGLRLSRDSAGMGGAADAARAPAAPADPLPTATGPGIPAFGNPTISGVQGNGFEQDIRIDPTNPNRIYTSAPGSLSSGTSWVWRSEDGGKTFKWVPAATPFDGKPFLTCAGGGDTELAVDTTGSLYYNDLTLVNFTTARSDDHGRTFAPSTCTSTETTPNDRQWYTTDGDPKAGGSLYLAYNVVGGDPSVCGTQASDLGANVLAMARSPGPLPGAAAGVQFAPSKLITASCQEGIMGNNEVSPVSHRIFIIHDNAALDAIRIARCSAVPFTTDPTGLTCVDLPVASFPGFKTGQNFPVMAIDAVGNLFVVWTQAPKNAQGQIIGDTSMWWTSSTNEGNTWRTPVRVPTPGLNNNVYPWVTAGSAGRAGIAWYGTPAHAGDPEPRDLCGSGPGTASGPDNTFGDWGLYYTQTSNGAAATPTFTPPVLASDHLVHRGTMFTISGGACGDRANGDFLQMRMGSRGEVHIAYSQTIERTPLVAHAMYTRQTGGPSLLGSSPSVNGAARRINSAADVAGDGRYEANGTTNPNRPNVDILSSRISRPNASTYRVTMEVADLRTLANGGGNPDPVLLWHTQWFVPSATSPDGGKNLFVYMQSEDGGPPTFWVGEGAVQFLGGGAVRTYPGREQITGSYTATAPGTITIDVPASKVAVPHPYDGVLHAVTASTQSLATPADACPVEEFGIAGCLFNLIDVAPAYDFTGSFGASGHAHTDYNRNGVAGVQDVHIESTVSGPGGGVPTGTVKYDDLRRNPPGEVSSNIRCVGTPRSVVSLGPSSVRISGAMTCRTLSKARTFVFDITDRGPNPPNRDAYHMVIRNSQGRVLYDWADDTTPGLGDLRVTAA